MKQVALSLFVIASSGVYVWNQASKDLPGNIIDTADPAGAASKSLTLPSGPRGRVATGSVPATVPPSPGISQPIRLEPPAVTPTTIGGEVTGAIAVPAGETPAAEEPPLTASQPRVFQLPDPPSERTSARPVADTAPRTAVFAITPAAYIPIPQPRPDYPQASVRVIKAGMKSSVNPGTKSVGHGFADGTYTGPVADAYYGLIQIQASIQGGRLTALKVLKYPNDRRTSVSINRQALPMLRDAAISAQSANVDIISGATLTSRAFMQSLGGALKKASS